jgi:hypothetical protein
MVHGSGRGNGWSCAELLPQTILRDPCDAGEDVGQPSLRIDVVQPASRDRRDHDSGRGLNLRMARRDGRGQAAQGPLRRIESAVPAAAELDPDPVLL